MFQPAQSVEIFFKVGTPSESNSVSMKPLLLISMTRLKCRIKNPLFLENFFYHFFYIVLSISSISNACKLIEIISIKTLGKIYLHKKS